jgi:hypothetical protein
MFLELMKLPAAQQMDQKSFDELLSIASRAISVRGLRQWSYQIAAVLVEQLPIPAAQMTYEQVHTMFVAAALQLDVAAAACYAQLPVLYTAKPADLAKLLRAALRMCEILFKSSSTFMDRQARSFAVLEALCRVESAQQLSHHSVAELLDAALRIADRIAQLRFAAELDKCLQLLCLLPRASLMLGQSCLHLLKLSSKHNMQHTTSALCGLLSSKLWVRLNSSEAQQLLLAALPTKAHSSVHCFSAICALQCIRQAVDVFAVMLLLKAAVASLGTANEDCRATAAAVEMLLQLPLAAAAVRFRATVFTQLLGSVVQRCSEDFVAVQLLQHLQLMGRLPGPDDLVSLIRMCLKYRPCHRDDACAAACIKLLCTDPAAQQVSASTVQQLLLNAVALQQPHAILALVQGLPAAAQLNSRQAEQLLHDTVSAAIGCHVTTSWVASLSSASKDAAKQLAAMASAWSWSEALSVVACMPAACSISKGIVLEFLEQAIKQGASNCVWHLLRFDCLQQLSDDSIGALLRRAIHWQQPACWRVIKKLHGATAGSNAEDMVQFLQQRVQ